MILKNKKLILLILLIIIIISSFILTWAVLDSKFNKVDSENQNADNLKQDNFLVSDDLIGRARIKINITS
ncbi:MAG: hypothetical protein KAQ83_00700 [Nanoarchaeota archaeon]|nr:hypothetical protein [Nanoarchaeota archaeon]